MNSVSHKRKRLYYGDIALIPAEQANRWHVPGRRTLSTHELIEMADTRELSVVLETSSKEGVTTRRLN